MQKKMNQETKNPKIFISYSWSSPEYEKTVVSLAEKLVSDGINVVFDKWDLKEGQDKYTFMEQMVTGETVNKVLILCDQLYAEKADQRKGGVGTESQIISDEVYTRVKQEKFIPVIMEVDRKGKPYLPTYLKSRIYINLSSPQGYFDEYEKLIRNIYGKPIYQKPKIGTPPSYVTTEQKTTIKTTHKFEAFRHTLINGKGNSSAFAQDYLVSFLSAFHDFRIHPKDSVEFDETVLESIHSFKPYREQFAEFVNLICLYSQDNSFYEMILDFLEQAMRFKYAPEGVGSYNEIWFDNYAFILRELFMYLISILIHHKKYTEACFFLSEKYFYKSNIEKKSSYYDCFDSHLTTLDEIRNERLKLNRVSVFADTLRERSDSQFVTFDELIQTELILCIRGLISKTVAEIHWYPRSLVYAERYTRNGLDLFFRAESKRYFDAIKTLLDISSKQDLVERLKKADEKYKFSNWRL